MGKLYIIEGIDGSGKTTQTALLKKRLSEAGLDVMQIKFPMYDQPSSALIRMYLAGEFGQSPADVNAYAASAFYAVDRYASYKKIWGEAYRNGTIILSDRYVTSNMIHQGSKLDVQQALAFFQWAEALEYDKMELPRPDRVFFLDVPPDVSLSQVERRYGGDDDKKDIHEKDRLYLKKCYDTAKLACKHGYMKRIECVSNGKIMDMQTINDSIYKMIVNPDI